MKLLSIDVGMKNLAYCLLDVSQDKSYSIEDWRVVDICDVEKQTCCHPGCKVEPRFTFEGKLYCRNHAKLTPLGIPTADLAPKKVKKLSLKELYAFAEKHGVKFEKPILKRSLSELCIKHVENNFVGMIVKPKATELDLIELGRNMTKQFDSLFKDIKIDSLIIENQISPIANRMKTLQGMITQYFIMNGVGFIKFLSSSNKLKEFSTKQVTSYNERKKLGIQVTHSMLLEGNNTPHRISFESSKKKDDLADCFLQALWYIKTSG